MSQNRLGSGEPPESRHLRWNRWKSTSSTSRITADEVPDGFLLATPWVHAENNVRFVERRQAQRYRVAFPVQLEPGSGETRDLSTSGAYFETDRSFIPGTLIRFSLLFRSSLHVRCEGRVVRVEPGEGKVGVAVAFTSYRFESAEQPPGAG